MSVRVMAAVWESSPHRGGTLLVQLAIADHANDEGVAWPSVDSLGRKARMSSRNVQLALARLQESGALAIEHGQGGHGCNLYRLWTTRTPENTSPPKTFQGEKSNRGGEVFDRGGEKNDVQGVNPASPEPSVKSSKESSLEPSRGARKRAKPPRQQEPEKDRYSEFEERFGQIGTGWPINGLTSKNRQAVNETPHPVDLVAEGYLYLVSGWWEHDWAGKDKTVWQAVECLGDYIDQRDDIRRAVEAAQSHNGATRPIEFADADYLVHST
jgi:hypothetical protein